MIRILCPHCHVSLSPNELEQADINDHLQSYNVLYSVAPSRR